MLFSEDPRIIFIHMYKNAGTSVRRAFLKAGLQDDAGARGLTSHATASEVIRGIGPAAFSAYLSFVVVRNPRDWQVSLCRYALGKPNHHQHEMVKEMGSFKVYLDWRCRDEVRPQKGFVADAGGAILVNRIIRFENLADDFNAICRDLGIIASLPHLNASNRSHWQDCYDERTFALVEKTFADDIELFGYDDCRLA